MTGIFQRSFVGGEATDEVVTRFDADRLQVSVARAENFQVLRHGGVGNRGGSQYVGTSDATVGQLLLKGFVFSDAQAYCIEIGREDGGRNGYLRVIQDGAYIAPEPSGAWGSGSTYSPGDVVTDGGTTYVAVADVPAGAASQPVFYASTFQWYPLPVVDGNSILELPTPYGAEFADPAGPRVHVAQQGDSLVFTSSRDGDIQVYELTRLSADNWTFLPKAFKPAGTSTALTTAFPAPSGSKVHRWKLVVIDEDGKASAPAAANEGPYSGTVASGTVASPPSYIGGDLEIDHGSAHPFSDGDEIKITGTSLSGPTAFQNAIVALKETTWRVTSTGTNTFTLDGSRDLFDRDAVRIAAGNTTYPAISLAYDYAYWEVLTANKAIGSAHSFSWAAVPGAREYHLFWSYDGGPYEFVKATTDTSYTGDAADTSLPDIVLPDYSNPFTIGGDTPAACAFHGQRQVFAGSANRPDRVSGSRVGDLRDFTLDFVEPTADDPYRHDIAPEEAQPFYGLASIGQLAVLGEGSIRIMGGDADGVITFDASGSRIASAEGSANIQPLVVDDRLLYVESRSTYIRELAYNLTTGGFEGYVGRDMGIWAEHLFRGYTIVDWAYTRIPESTVWVVRSDGVLLGLTYVVEQDVWAWHRHRLGGDDVAVKTVCAIPESNQDVLYVGVKRTIDGSDVQYIERLLPRKAGREPNYDIRSDALFLDSYLTYDGTNTDGATYLTLTNAGSPTWLAGDAGYTLTATAGTPFTAGDVGNGFRLSDAAGNEVECEVTAYTSTTIVTVALLTDCPLSLRGGDSTTAWVRMVDDISGLDHLEGETVGILADGNVLAQDTVTSGALTTFARPYGIVHVGVPITAELELLPLDSVDRQGASADKKRVVNAATLFMINSRGVTAGPDSSTQRPFELETGETTSTLITGRRQVRLPGLSNREGRIVIQQAQPLPAALAGVIRNVSFVGGR